MPHPNETKTLPPGIKSKAWSIFLTIGLRPGGRFENDYQCDLDVLPCLTIITFSLALVLLKLDDCCALVTTSKLVAISRMRHLLSDMLVTFDTSLIGSP